MDIEDIRLKSNEDMVVRAETMGLWDNTRYTPFNPFISS